MTRMPLRLSRLAAFAAFAAALALPGYAIYSAAAADKCTIAVKGDSVVAKACSSGGRAEAKKLMKEMVKTAKTKGAKFACEDCHEDLNDFQLTKNGRDDMKKLLDAIKP